MRIKIFSILFSFFVLFLIFCVKDFNEVEVKQKQNQNPPDITSYQEQDKKAEVENFDDDLIDNSMVFPVPEGLPNKLINSNSMSSYGDYLMIGELPEKDIYLYCDNQEEKKQVYIRFQNNFQRFDLQDECDFSILPELTMEDWDEDGQEDLVVKYFRYKGEYFDGERVLPGVVYELVVYQWSGNQWEDIHFYSGGGPILGIDQ